VGTLLAVAELALDDSSDDNRDDSGSLKHHGYGPKRPDPAWSQLLPAPGSVGHEFESR